MMAAFKIQLLRRHLEALLAAVILSSWGSGCAYLSPSPSSRPKSRPVVPAKIYANYKFEVSQKVMNFGIQPLWIPTCLIWEVMARDANLQADLRRLQIRLAPYAFFKGLDMNDSVKEGKLQGGMVGDLPAMKLAMERNIRIVSLIQQGPCSILARESVPLTQLRGRPIGISPGSNAHYALIQILDENGMSPEDVKLVPMDTSEMAPALARRRIDAFAAWEPTPSLAMLDHPQFEVLARKDARGFIFFTRAFTHRHPDVVNAMVASEVRALRWLRMNDKNLYLACRWAHDRAQSFGRKELPLTAYDFLRLSRRDLLRIPSAPRISAELLSPGGDLYTQFELSRKWGALPVRRSDWSRIKGSFAVETVPQVLSAPLPYRLDDFSLTTPLGGK